MAKGDGKGHALVDLTGQRFGNWLVLMRAENNAAGQPKWLCRCQCGSGVERSVLGMSLKRGASKGCGCIHREASAERCRQMHPDPHSHTQEYKLYQAAKHRAGRDDLPFDISWRDVEIPTHCPVLGIELKPGDGKPTDNSPSLDKMIPELGYVKGNVRVISFRANSIKRDATADELRKVLQYIESAQAA